VDDLLEQFRAHHQSAQTTSVASLRQPYNMLVFKVLALVQDSDSSLARTISGSREAIWAILADREKFNWTASAFRIAPRIAAMQPDRSGEWSANKGKRGEPVVRVDGLPGARGDDVNGDPPACVLGDVDLMPARLELVSDGLERRPDDR